jgi:chitin disaccharide deacetylase
MKHGLLALNSLRIPPGDYSGKDQLANRGLRMIALFWTARLFVVRRLIFNADDFGLTAGINYAIIEAHTHGVLTSASLMANASATSEALQTARMYPRLGLGCHVVLVDGEPLTDPARLSSLVPRGSSAFGKNVGKLAARTLFGRVDRDQIEVEATAQFRELQSQGITFTHFDTHKHTHMFPGVLEGLLRSARVCGIPAVRNPFEPPHSLTSSFAQNRALWKRSLQTIALRLLRENFLKLVHRAGLKTTDGTVGIAATGSLDAPLFKRMLDDLPEGTWEFVCHPGYCDEELRAANTRLLKSRETELQLLTATETREQLEHAGIALISYADL